MVEAASAAPEVDAVLKLRLTPSEFTAYLRALRQRLMVEFHAQTPWDLNNGFCSEFADTVENEVDGAVGLEYGHLHLDYSDFTKYKIDLKTIPRDEPRPDIDELPSHVFVRWHGRFYDAECLRGVDDPRKLPLYQYNIRVDKTRTHAARMAFREKARQASILQDCTPYSLLAKFALGYCVEFALALSHVLGYDKFAAVFGLFPDDEGTHEEIAHVFVRHPKHPRLGVDVYGVRPIRDIVRASYFAGSPARVGWRDCATWQECHDALSTEDPYKEVIAEAATVVRANRVFYTQPAARRLS